MNKLIQARILKGFRDFLPEQEITRNLLIEKLSDSFKSFGFVPIDTPILEYSEILLRKSEGETEKQVFRFKDNGGRDVAMRFDLTVPFARFVAEHKDKLGLPFKRYHIAKVWRGEKPQAGRYREFMQCDFDIVGSDSAAVDFEIINLMRLSLANIGVENITIKFSHRGIFNRFLSKLGLSEKSEDVLRIVDKLAKIGEEKVLEQLSDFASVDASKEILSFIRGVGDNSDFYKTLEHVENLAGGPDLDTMRMREVYAFLEFNNISRIYCFDPSITRGLDYYTGIVFETFLNDLPNIGSICSGGRYDNLAGLYIKDNIPGVGSSIGLDRLIAGLEMLGQLKTKKSFTDLVVFCLEKDDMLVYQAVAEKLRCFNSSSLNVEVFPDAKKLGQQFNWAENKGVDWGLFIKKKNDKSLVNFIENDFFELYSIELRNLSKRESLTINSFKEIFEKINK